jgi:hypothetical protein
MDKTYFLLSLSLFLVLFHGSLGRRADRPCQQQQQGQCQLDRLNALRPDDRIKCEAGVIESWDPNHDQFLLCGPAPCDGGTTTLIIKRQLLSLGI